MSKKIRVLIVDDSPFICKALTRIFEAEPATEVAGVAKDGKEAIEKALALNPDVITLDIMMPEMDGIETLKVLMKTKPTPVLMLSQFTRDGAEFTLSALELGAMDFIDKSATGLMDFYGLAKEITSKVKAIADSKLQKISALSPALPAYKGKGIIDVVAVGSSTGGPTALQMLLSKFPRDIGFAVLIVQHMPHGFTGPLARRLDSLCMVHVKEAESGDKIEPGVVLIAPSGLHLTAGPPRRAETAEEHRAGIRCRVKLDVEPMDTVHRPSVDVLFSSVARRYGDRCMGVILTGMGSDGAVGMKSIKKAGGITIAQDRETSTIFGMPKVAIENNAVDKIVPITSMAEEILKAV
ncbi:MAG: chemotaxis response regulator protein-glutamate methylesterase [Nitrospirota bacterium]|nr:chemotaxis response regulator protein-glutamate methylesterase [Nitrospirota bacterium]